MASQYNETFAYLLSLNVSGIRIKNIGNVEKLQLIDK